MTNNQDSVSPRKHYLLFSTKNPPAIQRIPWPSHEDTDEDEHLEKRDLRRYMTWIINEQELPWLVESNGASLPSVIGMNKTNCCGSGRIEDFALEGHRGRNMDHFRWQGILRSASRKPINIRPQQFFRI
jgi:hypothetical protein